MTERLVHRGPDDTGYWLDSTEGLALGHSRLAILDLSSAGHQPMASRCGRYQLVFNGEIYNHLSIRKRLGSHLPASDWRSLTDTETLLASFASWGIEKTLKGIVGMFALALWDRQERVLTLARDRMGEKPLYWGWSNDLFVFGSELKALKCHPSFNGEIDREALALFLRHSYVPSPFSIFRGIEKLKAGHYVEIPLRGDTPLSKQAEPVPYWSVKGAIQQGLSSPFHGSPESAVDALEDQLSISVADQMLSDVPLGGFLSGGVDSSTIVALMQRHSRRPVRTFTIGFDDGVYNEASDAKAVAKYLGTEHTELYIRSADAQSVIPKLPSIYCEPFADSSQIPTFLVSQLARKDVTVALSGDGGDEIFGGYNRYLAARNVWGPVQRLPVFSRKVLAGCLRFFSPSSWDKIFEIAKPALPRRYQLTIPGEKARKLADVIALKDGHAFYRQLTGFWTDPANLVIGDGQPMTGSKGLEPWQNCGNIEQSMMSMDARTYLPDDILTKIDRAAMAVGLETRVPMLDHRVFELAWRMPLDYKIRNGQGKWLLRQVLYRHVPRELIERPKMGFGVPLDAWLRGPLRAWAEGLLDESRLTAEGFLHPEPIRRLWAEHLRGKRNWQYHLWNVLMFQAWLEQST
jgi:asparagine synthase (glutamine-hydrolysing)